MKKAKLKEIQRIEKEVYPEFYHSFQDLDNWREMKEYCEGTPRIKQWPTGYCIVTKKEVVDLASTSSLSLRQIHELIAWMRKNTKGRVFVNARECTSYKLMKYAQRRKWIKVHSLTPYMWGSEKYWDVEFTFQ